MAKSNRQPNSGAGLYRSSRRVALGIDCHLSFAATSEFVRQPRNRPGHARSFSRLDADHAVVAAIDGVSYEQDSDGGFIQQGNTVASSNAWTGLTSTVRTSGSFSGSTARQTTVHGGGDLQGVDTQGVGLALIKQLTDPTAAPILSNYLNQTYDADLNGGAVLRATAYERMLYNNIVFLTTHTGGTESQNLFQMSSLYASQIALEKLQALFPNANYVFSEASALNYVKMVFGMVPDTFAGQAARVRPTMA